MTTAISLPAFEKVAFGDCMASIKMTFAANLRRIMRVKDLKAKDMAAALGVSASQVTHWRNADKFPSSENLEAICTYLGVPYADLFREGTEPNPGQIPEPAAILQLLLKAYGLRVVPDDEESR